MPIKAGRTRRRLLGDLGVVAAAGGLLPNHASAQSAASTSTPAAGEPAGIRTRQRESGAPGLELILGRSDERYPRHSEGDLVRLEGGELLAVWSRFSASSDHARAQVVGRRSSDAGRTWGDIFPVASLSEPSHRLNSNLMGPSLLPLKNKSRILMTYSGKEELEPENSDFNRRIRCSIFGRFTEDGREFSPPFLISDRDHYYICIAARVLQLSSGRILVPVAVDLNPGQEFGWKEQSCLTFFSDDGGANWKRGQPCTLPAEEYHSLDSFRRTLQEPGLIELRDGRIFMVIRTRRGHPFRSFSEDGGETWSAPKPMEEITAPASPQTLIRLPDSDHVAMVYNNNPKGAEAAWSDRRPLALAVSSDEGDRFHFRQLIEEKECRCWSYPACRIYGDDFYLLTYEWMQQNPTFFFTDFKLSIIPVSWFES